MKGAKKKEPQETMKKLTTLVMCGATVAVNSKRQMCTLLQTMLSEYGRDEVYFIAIFF